MYRARCRYSSLCAFAWAEYERSLNASASNGAEMPLESNDDPSEWAIEDEINPVMLEAASWVRHGRKLQLTELLGGTFNPDSRGIGGRTLMMEAAINNRKPLIKLFDSFGADINLVDVRHGRTALHYAYFYGYDALGEYMVQKLGADPDILDYNNQSCYDMVGLKDT